MLSPEIQCPAPTEESNKIKFEFTAPVQNFPKIQSLPEESPPVKFQFKVFVESHPKIQCPVPQKESSKKIQAYDNGATSSENPVPNTSRGKFISQSSV